MAIKRPNYKGKEKNKIPARYKSSHHPNIFLRGIINAKQDYLE